MKFEGYFLWTSMTLSCLAFASISCDSSWLLQKATDSLSTDGLCHWSHLAVMLMSHVALFSLAACVSPDAPLPDDYFKMFNQQRGRSINTTEVKKIYKRLSLKYHPDRNKEPDAQQNFMKVNQAYEVLMDDEKRNIYERFGEEGLKNAANGQGGGFRDPFDIFAQYVTYNYYVPV